jgi:hypothetical protein
MHFGTLDNTSNYLAEINRVLKPGGVGVVFFSRMLRSAVSQTWDQVLADIEKEEEGPGYREGGPLTRVRGVNIQMTMWKMKELVNNAGFNILDITASSHVINNRRYFFGQYGIIFRKPAAKGSSSTTGSVSTTDVKSTPSKSRIKRRSGKK